MQNFLPAKDEYTSHYTVDITNQSFDFHHLLALK